MRRLRFRFRMRTLVWIVLATGLAIGGFVRGRQSGFFHEQAGIHLESEQLLAMPPPRALTGHYVRGAWEPTDHPETPLETANRLRQVAYHRRMRTIFSWLDGRPAEAFTQFDP